MSRVLIVGGAAAGLSTAEALRRVNFDGEVVVAGEELERAYDRPPLSKQVLSGEWDESRVHLFPDARLQRLNADVRLGARATAADLDRRSVIFDDGSSLTYDDLVVATGVRPRQLPNTPDSGVFSLRTLEDSRRIRAALLDHRELLIIGAGFLGLEVAATASKLGANVTVIEPQMAPLSDRLGAYTADRLINLHREAGIDIRTGVGFDSFIFEDEGGRSFARGIRTTAGDTIESSSILVAIGCVPNTEWLQESAIDLSNGVVCDEYCRAAPNVWAAGDVAQWHHPGIDRSVRLEHRMNASEQAAVVAANIVGETRRFTPVPFFWTDHYHAKIQLAGVIPAASVERTEYEDGDSFVRTFWADDRLMGVVGWNAAKAMMPFRQQLDLSEPATI